MKPKSKLLLNRTGITTRLPHHRKRKSIAMMIDKACVLLDMSLSFMNELKNRGVKDIMVICADGLSGIKGAIETAFPKTEYQRCIVHQVRNTLKYVADKDRKQFATDLKTIYHAATEQKAIEARKELRKFGIPPIPMP